MRKKRKSHTQKRRKFFFFSISFPSFPPSPPLSSTLALTSLERNMISLDFNTDIARRRGRGGRGGEGKEEGKRERVNKQVRGRTEREEGETKRKRGE